MGLHVMGHVSVFELLGAVSNGDGLWSGLCSFGVNSLLRAELAEVSEGKRHTIIGNITSLFPQQFDGLSVVGCLQMITTVIVNLSSCSGLFSLLFFFIVDLC